MPDEARLRHARRLLAGAPFPSYLALEMGRRLGGGGSGLWRTPSGAALIDLRTILDHTGPRGPWPDEEPPARASLPADLDGEAGQDWMLPSMLKPVEKCGLDLISDWPWLTPDHLGALMGLKRSRPPEVVVRLCEMRLAVDARVEGRRRLAVTDRALAMLARRDRASVGAAKSRWSVAPIRADPSLRWRNVAGKRSRQLLRKRRAYRRRPRLHRGPFEAGRSRSREIVQLDPPRRASRYFGTTTGFAPSTLTPSASCGGATPSGPSS